MAYREGARVCEMCREELARAEELALMGGLMACQACRTEVPREAARAWGLTVQVDEQVHEKQSRYGNTHVHARVHIRLPTEIPMMGKFRAENVVDRAGAALGKGDHTLGDEAFDQKVLIHTLEGEPARLLLAEPTVRQALMEAVEAAGAVQLDTEGVKLQTRQHGSLAVEDVEAQDRAGIALSIAIERWARGAPGGALTQPGCKDRPSGERPAAAQSAWSREESPPPVDSVYTAKEKPGPPCPACGELMTNAVTEYICKGCGSVVERPEVVQRMRQSAIKQGLILAALLLGVVLAIILSVVFK